MAKAVDMGKCYRIPSDNRDLNYSMYLTDGQKQVSELDDYTSHNTQRLTVGQVKDLLLKLEFIQKSISKLNS